MPPTGRVVYTFTRDWEAQNDPRMKLSIADYKVRSYAGQRPDHLFLDHFECESLEDQKNRQRQLFTRRASGTLRYVENIELHRQQRQIERPAWYIPLRYSDVLLLVAGRSAESGRFDRRAVNAAVNAVRRRGFSDTSTISLRSFA